MGTNYYWMEDACPTCGRGDERSRVHIGKSSAGWCFALHVYPQERIHDLQDWEDRWLMPKSGIVDEYGEVLTSDEMRDRITNRQWHGREPTAEDLRANHAMIGPNGLLRSTIDGTHCIGHGEGTWDLFVGYFS